MIWKKENKLVVGYNSKEAVRTKGAIFVISTEYRQPYQSKGKYYSSIFQGQRHEFETLNEAKKAMEKFWKSLTVSR